MPQQAPSSAAAAVAAAVNAPTGEPEPQIEIIDETPQQQQSDDAAAGMAELQKQLADRNLEIERQKRIADEERNRRVRVEGEMQRIGRERDTAAGVADRARYESAVAALTSLESQQDAFKQALTKALEEGEHGKVGDLQIKIGETSAAIVGLRAAKAEYEQRSREKPAASEGTQQPQQPPQKTRNEMEEDFIAAQDPGNAAWIRANRERFFNDRSFMDKAVAASQHAVKNMNLTIGSPEYNEFLDVSTGLKQAAPPTPTPAPTPAPPVSTAATPLPQHRQAPPPAAPPSRSAPPSAGNGGTPGVIRLTKEELDFCKLNEIPPAAYHRRKEELAREGRMGTTQPR